jgi:type II secretory pathway pseudopilin PulG
LIEVLVTIGIIAILVGLLVPGLAGARQAARGAACMAQQRSLVSAWTMYANDFGERAMPLAYTSAEDVGPGGMARYWWGSHGTPTTPPDHGKGFISAYLDANLSERSVFECPGQAWGTYVAQGPGARWPTSTYGYNGYFLSPAKTPGYDAVIGNRPWQRVGDLRQPSRLFVFADAMIRQSDFLRNCALLDPPLLYIGGGGGMNGAWTWNTAPTTAFRHGIRAADARGMVREGTTGTAMTARADGSVLGVRGEARWMVAGTFLGSAMGDFGIDSQASAEANELHYVPDARSW